MKTRKPGRPSEGLTRVLFVRVTEDMHAELEKTAQDETEASGSPVTIADIARRRLHYARFMGHK